MLKKHSQIFEGLFTASDLFVVSIAWTLSYWIRFTWGVIPVDKGVPDFGIYLRSILFIWLIWAFVFRRFDLYRPMRGSSRFREIWTVVKANSLAVLLLMAITFLFREKSEPFSRLVFVIFFGVSTVLTVASRSLVRLLLRAMRRRGYNQRYAVIVGAGELAKQVASRMVMHPEFGLELVGCLSKDESPLLEKTCHSIETLKGVCKGHTQVSPEVLKQIQIIGTYKDLPELLARGEIDQVIIALPLSDHDQMGAIVASIGDAMVDVRIVPDVYQFIQLGSRVEEFDGLPVVCVASTPLYGFNRILKRVVDFVFGSFLLTVLSPVILLTAIVVRVTSKGPIFYSQERVGLDGRPFKIYKFRTMHVDAEKGGAKFAVRGDPRVTRLGRFLRRFNIDELPQLVNVIKGHMSLVGPRPERPVFIEEFRRHVPRYMLRHKVQAGITGWAQVHGWRGNTSIERRIEHDLYYIEHWSLGLDLKILGLTVLNSFRDRNAY